MGLLRVVMSERQGVIYFDLITGVSRETPPVLSNATFSDRTALSIKQVRLQGTSVLASKKINQLHLKYAVCFIHVEDGQCLWKVIIMD